MSGDLATASNNSVALWTGTLHTDSKTSAVWLVDEVEMTVHGQVVAHNGPAGSDLRL